MLNLNNLEQRILAIEARNQRVELEKKWQDSLERKISIVLTTYGAMWLLMLVIHVEKAWLNAIIPTFGFILSTLSLPFFKAIWLKRQS